MIVKKIQIYLLDNASHLGFTSDVLAALVAIIHQGIVKMRDVFSACVQREAESYKIVRPSELTPQKADTDQKRDNVFVGMNETVHTSLRRSDPVQAEAARRLKIVFDAYNHPRPLTQLPLNAETAAINELLAELNANHADDMQAIGLDTWAAELAALNTEFARLAGASIDEKAAKLDYTHKDARHATDAAWRDLCTVIEAVVLTEGEEPYRDSIAKLNAVVKTYADRLAQHKGRAGSEQETTEKKAEL